jgi:hypothetical protein
MMGKLGSIAVQLYLREQQFHDNRNPQNLSRALWVFAALMLAGAIPAWVWLPNVQHEPQKPPEPTPENPHPKGAFLPVRESKSLELLAQGWRYAVSDPSVDILTPRPTRNPDGTPFIRNAVTSPAYDDNGELKFDEDTGLPVSGEGQVLTVGGKLSHTWRAIIMWASRLVTQGRHPLVADVPAHEMN